MILLIAVLAVLSAAFLFLGLSRRQRRAIPARIPDTTNLRPLFEPSRQEIADAEREAEAREIARREYTARAEARSIIDAAINEWRKSRNGSSAAALLNATVNAGDAKDFSRAAEEIIEYFRKTSFASVSASDLADLIDSHRTLLPISERGSGTLFWLKEEVAKLRSLPSGLSAAQKTI